MTASSSARPVTLDIDCRLSYDIAAPTDCVFLIHALNGRDQTLLSESLVITPTQAVHVFADPAQGHRFTRLQAAAGPLELHYRARVQRQAPPLNLSAAEAPVAELPDEVLHYLLPTRYCESDLLANAALKLFGSLPPGASRVVAICDWIHQQVDYRPGSTDATSTARDVFTQRAGVCRDFAHLGITFCRALNIPARLVAGYTKFDTPPTDFHAVFEAYLGGEWLMFDATRMCPLDGLVRIASGRDAKDVAFATFFGPARMVSMDPAVTVLA